jgi:hypothetical protein
MTTLCRLVVASFGLRIQLACCVLGSPNVDLLKKRFEENVALYCARASVMSSLQGC